MTTVDNDLNNHKVKEITHYATLNYNRKQLDYIGWCGSNAKL